MRLGINIPLKDASGRPLTANGITERARMAEAAGFDGIWSQDSVSMNRPETLTWMAIVAAATERIEVGTSVYVATVRNPIELAQQLVTLQAIAPNRFSIGVGAGSGRPIQEMLGYDFDARFSRLHEHMSMVKALLEGATLEEVLGIPPDQVRPMGTMPQYATPISWATLVGRPRLLLGAWYSEHSLKKAIADYDGWMCSASRTNLATMREAMKMFRDLGGKRAMVATCNTNLTAPTERLLEDDSYYLYCDPSEAADRLALLEEMGFDDVLLVKVDYPRRKGLMEDDYTMEELEQIRALLPRDNRPPITLSTM